MRKLYAQYAALLTLTLVSACGAPDEEEAPSPPPQAAARPSGPPSAGTVLRVDPGLDALIPADARIEDLAGNFVFTEGPVWLNQGDGYLLFSDLRSNRILQWDEYTGLQLFMDPVFEGEYPEGRSVGSNGLTVDSEGRLVLMEHGNRRVSRIEADGSFTVLADRYQGRRLNSPNDGVYKSDGWLYFTDPPYGLLGQEDDPARELDFNGIYRLSPDGVLELLERGQSRPNGIAFSPDEETLYVANSDGSNAVWMAYPVLADGTLGEGRVFYDVSGETASGAPDGLKVDQTGNVFATGPGGVWVFDPTGNHLGTIQPDQVPANVAWGDDGSTLYMTARTGLYRIRLTTAGLIP